MPGECYCCIEGKLAYGNTIVPASTIRLATLQSQKSFYIHCTG